MVSALHINSVILHGVKKRTKGQAVEPEYSEVESDLSDRIRGFLQEQVRAALKFGREIIEEEDLSTVPGIIREYWTKTASLLECSKRLAAILQSSQPTQSPEGLLMIADATADGHRVFIIAKLEHERGAQATRTRDADGNLVFSMQFLDDLLLTTGSKVFKIGYFPIGDDAGASIQGLVVDRQASAHHVAAYFRESYLGCAWKERPEIVTERFYNTVQSWIDVHIKDPQKKARYQVGLISELQSQQSGLSVGSFAQTHLDIDDRDDFTRFARQTLPASELPKSIDFVRAKLNNVRLDTASGTVVMAPPEAMRNGTVTVEDDELGLSTIVVHDRISRTSGDGRFKS